VILSGVGVSTDNGVWTDGATMPVKLGETAAAIINGKLYVVGDGNPNTLAYDIAADTWVSDLAVRPQLGKDQIAHAINGKFYVFGGVASIGGTKTALDTVQVYDPVANNWQVLNDMPYPCFAAATAVIGGFVYFAGGVGSNIQTIGTVSRYNPANDTWQILASMPQMRDSAAAGTNGSKLFVFGGRTGGDSPSNGFDTVQIYDPATNTWISSMDASGPGASLAELPQARGGIVFAPYANGEFYVIGGETVDGAGATDDHVYDRVDIYNPITNTWRAGPPMPTARHGMSPVFFNNQIFIAGGGTHSGKSQSNLLEILQLPLP
jgi:N-acetylneuraminic acid mutarotase